MPQLDQLAGQLDRLATFDPGPFPVISLYLNLQADDRGRDRYGTFLKKTFPERIRGYAPHAPERKSLDRDLERIDRYLGDVPGSANGLALFACAGADLFEAIGEGLFGRALPTRSLPIEPANGRGGVCWSCAR